MFPQYVAVLVPFYHFKDATEQPSVSLVVELHE